MTAIQRDDFTVMVGRLNKLSVERHFDAYADIDWDDPKFALDNTDPRLELPALDPLRHTDWYDAQTPEVRAAVGCYRWHEGRGVFAADVVDVLSLSGDGRIAAVTAFIDPELFLRLGLPDRISP